MSWSIVRVLTRLLRQPRIDVERLAFHIVECGAEQLDARYGHDRRATSGAPGLSPARRLSSAGCGSSRKIKLCKHDGVCNCDLLLRDRFAFECTGTLTASTVVTTPPSTSRPAMSASVINVCRIGAGSASPLVSITMRSNRVHRPSSRRRSRSCSVCAKSVRTLQHRQPVVSSMTLSSLDFDQLMIESDLAELVDDDGGAREFRLTQQMAKYSSLAAAEEAGEHRDRNRVCSGHDGTSGATATCTRLAA